MPKSIILFIRRNYKLFSTLASVVILFGVYNTYLVDRSIINLRIALENTLGATAVEDLEKIKPLLKIPLLKEISKTTVASNVLVPLEIAENIISTTKVTEQIADVKFYLKSVIEAKEKERGGFLSALDRLNSRLFKPRLKLPKEKLLAQTKVLLAKIKSTQEKDKLQKLYYNLGNIYVQLANIFQAEDALLKAVEMDPNSALALKALFNLAWAYKSAGGYEKAVVYFQKVSQQYAQLKGRIDSKYQVADTWFKEGEYQKARDQYAQLSNEYPEFDIADLALYEAGSISFYYLDDRKAASDYLSKLEEKYPKAKIVQHTVKQLRPVMAKDFRMQGFKLLIEKKYVEAIETFRQAVEIAPLDGPSYSGMGLGFYWLKEKGEALYNAKKAVKATPDDEITLTNSLFIYINSGSVDEAIKIGEEYLSKRMLAVRRPEFYYNLGYAYVLKAKLNEATTYFDRAIRLNPDFAFAYNNLGCVLWALKNYSAAIKKFEEATHRYPAYADAYFNLGIAYFHFNRFEDSYKEFEKVLDVNPGYLEAREYLRRIKEILKYQP